MAPSSAAKSTTKCCRHGSTEKASERKVLLHVYKHMMADIKRNVAQFPFSSIVADLFEDSVVKPHVSRGLVCFLYSMGVDEQLKHAVTDEVTMEQYMSVNLAIYLEGYLAAGKTEFTKALYSAEQGAERYQEMNRKGMSIHSKRGLIDYVNKTVPCQCLNSFAVLATKALPKQTLCHGCNSMETGDTQKYKRCGGCKLVYYCSQECQRRDWKGRHKVECKQLGVGPSSA